MDVLIADDDVTSRTILARKLEQDGHKVITVSSGAEALEVLERKDSPRVALLDWMMPSPNGVEICREVRRRFNSTQNYTYIILVTGKISSDEIVEGLQAGADDYVTKPFNVKELRFRIRSGVRVIELQDQLLVTQEELRLQANHDSLTGIFNRAAVMRHLQKRLDRANYGHESLAVAMADIDHFKGINDQHGHQAGDAVLRETVSRLQEVIRPSDTLGRVGGEEFLIVLPGLEHGNTQPLERARAAVEAGVFETGTDTLSVTISMGVAWASNDSTLEGLIHCADEALYAAKAQGRNRVIQDPVPE